VRGAARAGCGAKGGTQVADIVLDNGCGRRARLPGGAALGALGALGAWRRLRLHRLQHYCTPTSWDAGRPTNKWFVLI